MDFFNSNKSKNTIKKSDYISNKYSNNIDYGFDFPLPDYFNQDRKKYLWPFLSLNFNLEYSVDSKDDDILLMQRSKLYEEYLKMYSVKSSDNIIYPDLPGNSPFCAFDEPFKFSPGFAYDEFRFTTNFPDDFFQNLDKTETISKSSYTKSDTQRNENKMKNYLDGF